MPLNEIIWGVAIVLLAGTVQGCTGFAFALITVPVLMLFMPHTEVPPLVVMLSFVNNLFILYDSRQFVRPRMVFPLWAGGFIGLPIGGYILKTIDPVSFKIIVGALVLVLSIVMLTGWRRKVKNETAGLVPVGFISGVLSSGTSIAGPPVILFFSNQEVERDVFRANLVTYFAFINIGAVIVFAFYGLLNHAVMVRTAAYIVPAIVGSIIGIRLSKFINEKLFGKLVLILVLILAIILVAKNITVG